MPGVLGLFRKKTDTASKTPFKRDNIVKLLVKYDGISKGSEGKVLAVGSDKLVVEFFYWRSCPFDRYRVTITADKLEMR